MQNFLEKYTQLKNLLCLDDAVNENIIKIATEYGYLPIPFDLAQKDLTNTDIFCCLNIILQQNNDLSHPLKKIGYSDDSWFCQEQLKIETLCLSGLKKEGKATLRNYLLKIITTPKGNPHFKLPGTVFYILPPYKRDEAFSSVYCPASIEIDPSLADQQVFSALGWDAEVQIQFFFYLAQLCGHPIVLDLLPQTGRFSKTIFVHPECFLWHDTERLQKQILTKVKSLASDNSDVLKLFSHKITAKTNSTGNDHLWQDYQQRKNSILKAAKFEPGGDKGFAPEELKKQLESISEKTSNSETALYNKIVEIDFLLNKERYSLMLDECTTKQKQTLERVKKKIKQILKRQITKETEISDDEHQKLIKEFIAEGLWTLPGGCWNSAGYPIFKYMKEDNGNTFPVYEHYNYLNNIVSGFAGDMDIVTPWYFALPHLAEEDNNLQQETINTYVNYCQQIYERFHPNGFRIDHLDHSADYPVSINNKGNSISYRAPLEVFNKLKTTIAKVDSTFVLLAEYMGWGDDNGPNLYKQYSKHNIRAGISLDIVGEYRHNAKVIIDESNQQLEVFNRSNQHLFTLAHIHDNHDRSHPDIVRALSEFTKERALLKWFKCIFLPGGKYAQRPTIYLDGNQTHTANKNFAQTFLEKASLVRKNDLDFYVKFDALYRNSLSCETLRYGYSKLLYSSAPDEKSNNTINAWTVISECNENNAFLIVANEYIDDNTTATSNSVDFSIPIPAPYWPVAEWILPQGESVSFDYFQILDIVEIPIAESNTIAGFRDENTSEVSLLFKNLKQNEFRIYRMIAEI